MKHEGWQYDATRNAELARAPMDFEATSLPRTPDDRNRRDPNTGRFGNEYDQWPRESRRPEWDRVNGEPSGETDVSSESDRQRSWVESLNQLPPPYASEDSYSRGSRSRDDTPMDEIRSSSRASATNSLRDGSDSPNDRTLRLKDSGGGGGKDDDLWV